MIRNSTAYFKPCVDTCSKRGRLWVTGASFCFFIAFAILSSIARGASILDIEDGAGEVGNGTIELSIRLSNAYGLTSLDFTLQFDPILMEIVAINHGTDTDNFFWLTNNNGDNIQVMSSGEAILVNDAEVGRLSFSVAGTSPGWQQRFAYPGRRCWIKWF